jgi:hypothetical protein
VTPGATCQSLAAGIKSGDEGDHSVTPLLPETEPLPDAVATMLPDASMMDTLNEKLESDVALFQTSILGINAESAEGLPEASHEISPVTFEPPA